ncbi:MAG: homoserine O-acetyltransferase [Thermoguttaceae bacterium]|nr:homoserine O-acetyltransferase [Thermoguttaceae bacterium]
MDTSDLFDSSDSSRSGKPLAYVQTAVFPGPIQLSTGGILPELKIAYETYGTLSSQKDNAVLIFHALSGDSHVAAHNDDDDPGWWDILVGPGKYVDTNRYFVICANVLGGCRGTTGPDSINPETGKEYGFHFPPINVADIVDVQRMLVNSLGIDRLLAIVGGSLGGLMALDWGTRYPEGVAGIVAIATGARMTTQALAFDVVARNAIMSDPNFNGGEYYDKEVGPSTGLAIARMLGHITYLSQESMNRKFNDNRNVGRKIDTSFETKFSVGSYLAYQGGKFVERFDANSYLSLTLALDAFDLGPTRKQLVSAMRRSMCRWLFVSFSSDWLFPAFQARELVDAAIASDKQVSYCNIESYSGHDAFLLENEAPMYGGLTSSFLHNLSLDWQPDDEERRQALNESYGAASAEPKSRVDYDRILALIPPKTKILDLGCGKGDLLAHLKARGHERLVGVEVEEDLVLRCMEKGLDVLQLDMNDGLKSFSDHQFDFVVLSKTLQTIKNVEIVLDEMLRVGTRAIVSFPNLGYKEYREQLESGHAPQTDPREGRKWYNSNDVRFLTIADFEEFCQDKGYKIFKEVALDSKTGEVVEDCENVNGDVFIVVLGR